MPQVFIGTSGWAYKDWGKKFFPKELPQSEHLTHLAQRFNTVEVNATFYRLQPKSNFEGWYQKTPKDFVFAIKVSQYITHIKRMNGVRAAWLKFLKRSVPLKEKRGPFLFQFHSSFTGKEHHIQRLDRFFKLLRKDDADLRVAIEFRHPNCFSEPMLAIFKKYRLALVFANSEKYQPAPWISDADFVYFRLHGPEKMFSSSYSPKELKELSVVMKKYLREGKDVFVYFNNDQNANAPANAKLLQELMKD